MLVSLCSVFLSFEDENGGGEEVMPVVSRIEIQNQWLEA